MTYAYQLENCLFLQITYADIHFFDFVNSFLAGGKPEVPEVLKNSPNLTNLYNGVMNEPSILAYLKKRPETERWRIYLYFRKVL